jgi:large subunit ribosomal protein L22e
LRATPRCPRLPFLLQHNVRDWLRVIASNKDRSVYELRYFNIADQAEDEDDEE